MVEIEGLHPDPTGLFCAADALEITDKFTDLNDHDRVFSIGGVTVKVRAQAHAMTSAEMLVYEVTGVLADPVTAKAKALGADVHLIGPHLVQITTFSAEPESVMDRIEEGYHHILARAAISASLHAQAAGLGSKVRSAPKEGPQHGPPQ